MSKVDITNMSRDKIQKQVEYYIKQRSKHKRQVQKVSAYDLIKKFKHTRYLFGKKRLIFYNNIIKEIINNNGGNNVNNIRLVTLFNIKK